jgi:hypothetical protein
MLTMPPADQAVLARRAEIVAALRRIVPGEGVVGRVRARAYEAMASPPTARCQWLSYCPTRRSKSSRSCATAAMPG